MSEYASLVRIRDKDDRKSRAVDALFTVLYYYVRRILHRIHFVHNSGPVQYTTALSGEQDSDRQLHLPPRIHEALIPLDHLLRFRRMVFFPAVQAVLNSSDHIPEPEPTASIAAAGTISATGDVQRTLSGVGQAGPGPSTTSQSARFTHPCGTMPAPQGPAIRKQNIACDACRSRKIRCQRVSIHQIVSFSLSSQHTAKVP